MKQFTTSNSYKEGRDIMLNIRAGDRDNVKPGRGRTVLTKSKPITDWCYVKVTMATISPDAISLTCPLAPYLPAPPSSPTILKGIKPLMLNVLSLIQLADPFDVIYNISGRESLLLLKTGFSGRKKTKNVKHNAQNMLNQAVKPK